MNETPWSVTLISFTATPVGTVILLEWETATELENAGFYITRDLDPDGTFPRISPFIPSESDGLTGWEYQYTDANVQQGSTYYYQLEAVSTGNISEFHGPITATLSLASPTATSGFSPTPGTTTATPTRTATSPSSGGGTPSATSTLTMTGTPPPPTPTPIRTSSPAATLTRTPTRIVTRTPVPQVPGQPSPTPTERPTAFLTPVPTPTTTLLPLPTIVLQYPELTPTRSTLTPTLHPLSVTETVEIVIEEEIIPFSWNELPLRLKLLGVLVALLWVSLGLFIFLYIKRIDL